MRNPLRALADALVRCLGGMSAAEIRSALEEVRAEIRSTREDLRREIADLRREMEEAHAGGQDKPEGPEIPVAEA